MTEKRLEEIKNDFNKMYDYLIDYDYFTKDELDLITNINGNTIETLNDCIYARYALRDIEQLIYN